MKIFVILILATIVTARPEPPSSYTYTGPQIPLAPSNNYGAPPPSNSYGAPPQTPQQKSTNYGVPPPQYGPPVIHKHVYVHVPPPEPEYVSARKPITFPPPQKHYKIVFIKAPTAPTPTAPVIPLQPQNEEKTLVYVLVKKPDDQPEIIVPTAVPTQPSKPEVYFIRYKTQKQEGYPESIAPAPAGDYGAPASLPQQPPSNEYGPPSHR